MTLPRAAGLLLLGAFFLLPLPGEPAAATSCVGPSLWVAEQTQGRPTVAPGDEITVEGRYFAHFDCPSPETIPLDEERPDGSDEEGSPDRSDEGSGWGCSAAAAAPASARDDDLVLMEDVILTIEQGDRTWRLGRSDAHGTGESFGEISWRVTVPDGLQPGRARIRAYEGRGADFSTAEVRVTVR